MRGIIDRVEDGIAVILLEEGGRVYSTAVLTMCLEVYYRYGKVFGVR